MNVLINKDDFKKNVNDIEEALKYIDSIIGNKNNVNNVWMFCSSQEGDNNNYFNHSSGKGTLFRIVAVIANSIIDNLLEDFEDDEDYIKDILGKSNALLSIMKVVFYSEIEKKLKQVRT